MDQKDFQEFSKDYRNKKLYLFLKLREISYVIYIYKEDFKENFKQQL